MGKLTAAQQLRSLTDYGTFIVRYQAPSAKTFLALDFVTFSVGLVGYASSVVGAVYALLWPAGRVVIAAVKLPSTIGRFRLAGSARIEKRDRLARGATVSQIEPSDKQARLGFHRERLGKDVVMRSPAVDRALSNRDWACAPNDGHRAIVAKSIRDNREFCLKYLTRGFENARGRSLFINETKWCLAAELDPAAPTLAVHRGGYFESYTTNEACTCVLVSTRGDEESGFPLFPAHFGSDGLLHLDDLEHAPVNNHVGVSTLAITSDRYLVIWQQGEMNVQDPGKIVSTGSGSGDFADVDWGSLRQTVVNGMERELRQESLRNRVRLPPGTIAQTSVIGFFRWLARGGKPEFVGVTRLRVPIDKVEPDHFEVFDVKKGKPGQKLQNRFFVPDVSALPSVIESIRSYDGRGRKLSLPLKVILRRLEEQLTADPAGVARMLFGP